jgi:hypothetical protein
MSKIVLISCVFKKRTYKCKVRDLYISPLFKKNLQYALKLAPDHIFILSAKYGLAELDDEIEPYDQTLNAMSAQENRQWARQVLQQLSEKVDLKNDQFIFLAGIKYRKNLVPRMTHVEIPLEGLRIGEQLQRLSK